MWRSVASHRARFDRGYQRVDGYDNHQRRGRPDAAAGFGEVAPAQRTGPQWLRPLTATAVSGSDVRTYP